MMGKNRMRTRWLVAASVVILLTLLGTQGSFTQDYAQQYALVRLGCDQAGHRLGDLCLSERIHRGQRAWVYCVRIAPTVQQEVAVPHPGER